MFDLVYAGPGILSFQGSLQPNYNSLVISCQGSVIGLQEQVW